MRNAIENNDSLKMYILASESKANFFWLYLTWAKWLYHKSHRFILSYDNTAQRKAGKKGPAQVESAAKVEARAKAEAKAKAKSDALKVRMQDAAGLAPCKCSVTGQKNQF